MTKAEKTFAVAEKIREAYESVIDSSQNPSILIENAEALDLLTGIHVRLLNLREHQLYEQQREAMESAMKGDVNPVRNIYEDGSYEKAMEKHKKTLN